MNTERRWSDTSENQIAGMCKWVVNGGREGEPPALGVVVDWTRAISVGIGTVEGGAADAVRCHGPFDHGGKDAEFRWQPSLLVSERGFSEILCLDSEHEWRIARIHQLLINGTGKADFSTKCLCG